MKKLILFVATIMQLMISNGCAANTNNPITSAMSTQSISPIQNQANISAQPISDPQGTSSIIQQADPSDPPLSHSVLCSLSAQPMPQPRVALVLGGGGARGAAHLGVITELEKAGVPIDLIVGTSIGSLVGALYADNPHADQISRILANTSTKNLVHISIFNLFKGPVSSIGIENFVETTMQAQQFPNLKIKFIAVASDINSGETIPICSGSIASAIAASMSLPPYFSPTIIDGHQLVDGGITDPVAVNIAKEYHPKVIIAVSIAETIPPAVPMGFVLHVYDRSELIRRQMYDQLSAAGADILLHPDVGQISLFDDTHTQQLKEAGQLAAQQALPQICAILAKNHIPSRCHAVLGQ